MGNLILGLVLIVLTTMVFFLGFKRTVMFFIPDGIVEGVTRVLAIVARVAIPVGLIGALLLIKLGI